MKILHTVQSYPPAEGGMAEVARQLSERLVALGHSVTVATEYHPARNWSNMNGVNVVQFTTNGNSVNGFKGDVAGYERFLLESHFDIVVNFAAQQWATDIALPLLPRIAGLKVFVPTGFSGLFSRRYKGYFRQLPEYMRRYDMNVFLSDCYRDICFARKHGIANTVLIPNGAAADEFLSPMEDIRKQLDIPRNHFLILHVGSHTGLKGHEEAMEIFHQADLVDSTLLIVGNEPQGGCGSLCREQAALLNASARFQANGKRIISTQLSRSDTVSAYHAADLFLFPSNIECSPIVLFECMASKTPFLVTDVGNSAEIIDWSGGGGVLLPSARPPFLPRYGKLTSRMIEKLRIVLGRSDDFMAVRAHISGSVLLLESLYKDAAVREKMARSGYVAWQKRFTWERIAGEYEMLYRKLVEE